MRRCFSHDQLFGVTRDLCERHGWRVKRGRARGEESKGSLVISRGKTSVVFPYRLPMLVNVWESHVRNVMESDEKRDQRAPIVPQETHA